jgi:methyl-accepting chemotaxis protein
MTSFLKKISFRNKLILITLPMFLGNLMWGNLVVWEHGVIMFHAKNLEKNLDVIYLGSQLIHEIQKEKNQSYRFSYKKLNKEDLEKNRKNTEVVLKKLKSKIGEFDLKVISEFDSIEKNYLNIQHDFDAQPEKLDLIENYSSLIKKIILFENIISDLDHLNGVEAYLHSIIMLESSKENLEKLNASIHSILLANKPVAFKDLDNVNSLKSNFSSVFTSNSLEVSVLSQNKIETISTSDEWKNIQLSIEKINEKAIGGGYELDADKIVQDFEKISSSMQELITIESVSIQKMISDNSYMARIWFFGASGFLTFATILVGILLTALIKTIVRDLQNVTNSLITNAEILSESSTGLTVTSSTLSSSTTEQASALQETASAIHEVTSTISQNSQNTQQSRSVSSESTRLSLESKVAIDKMVESIHKISESNQEIMLAVHEGNNEIGKIVKVIEEISDKTAVINDIVFQTKLLSFNASVEAARAGEHGKGFAVVAEEIGNLAQMSGNAAKEISTMLEESTKNVSEIVSNTKNRVEILATDAKRTLSSGVDIANDCQKSLDKVLDSVQTVDEMIVSISTASAEQSHGVSEINKAITQLDQITHQNSIGATDCAKAASELSSQSESMKIVANELKIFIQGS